MLTLVAFVWFVGFGQRPVRQTMSMAYTTQALATLRCLNDAKEPADTNQCRQSMDAAQDLMRTPDETKAQAAVAAFALSRLRFMEDRASVVADIRGEWSGSHPGQILSTDEVGRREASALKSPAFMHRFDLEARCYGELDVSLRAQVMKPIPECEEFGRKH